MALYPLAWTDAAPACLTGGAVSVGNFDGVHRGHQKLLGVLRAWAAKVNGPAVAITFDPPPVALLNPSALKPPLTTITKRAELLHAAGADHVVVLKVEASLLALSAAAFIEEVLQRQLSVGAIVEGSNFRFGRNRDGDAELLNTLEHRSNIYFEAVPVDEVSSSRVRELLNEGDVKAAAGLLGRSHAIEGGVVEGAKRGRTIGVPTANLDQVPTLVPGVGVYAVRAKVNEKVWPAAANVGPNPTFGENARKIEVHLLDFSGDLYGQQLVIEFVERLRDVKAFALVEELKKQLNADLTAAKKVLA